MKKKIDKFFSVSWADKKMILRKEFLMPILRKKFGHIGNGSCIEKALAIRGEKYMFIGDNTFIRPRARIECVTEFAGKQYKPQLKIGNNVNIEQNLYMTCAELIEICDNTTISSNVLITDINHSYKRLNVSPLLQELETRRVRIGSYTLIGAGAKIMPGVSIGQNVVVGANAVVTKSIPDYSIAAGVPAKVIKRYDFEKNAWISVIEKEFL